MQNVIFRDNTAGEDTIRVEEFLRWDNTRRAAQIKPGDRIWVVPTKTSAKERNVPWGETYVATGIFNGNYEELERQIKGDWVQEKAGYLHVYHMDNVEMMFAEDLPAEIHTKCMRGQAPVMYVQ